VLPHVTSGYFTVNCYTDGRAVADPERLSRGGRNPWRAREARAYNGGLGAEPPAGSRGRAPGGGSGGRSPPEAESFSVLRRRKETANLPLSCVLGSGLAYCT